MKNKFLTMSGAAALLLFALLSVSSCKKDARTPPELAFKTTSGYTSANDTVGLQDSILVGITATKTEDELKTFTVSHAYDGAATSTTDYSYTLTTAEEDNFSKDYTIVTRNQAGTEKWTFTIIDRDGNITSKDITLTVQ